MKKLITFCMLVLGAWSADAQMTVNGVTLPGKVGKAGQELVLNGGGFRKKVFFKVYTAGLYLEQKSTNGAQIINDDKPMGVRLQITSSVVSSENMSESVREGFGKSLKGKTEAMKPKIDAFITTFSKDAIKEGDLFELMYEPGVGVKAYKNGKLQGTTAGLDFKKALFGIWLGADPVDADLKAALLAGK